MADLKSVRIATKADEEAVLTHCKMHDAENGVYGVDRSVFPFDEDRAREMLQRAFNHEGGIIGVIGTGTELEASIFLLFGQLWHCSGWHLEEMYTFVHPDFRKTKHAKALGEFAKACADRLEIPLIGGLIANHRTESKLRLYQRTYGDPVGCFFVYHTATPPKPQGKGLRFWDHPFPRDGVAVVETRGMSREDIKVLEDLRAKKSSGNGMRADG